MPKSHNDKGGPAWGKPAVEHAKMELKDSPKLGGCIIRPDEKDLLYPLRSLYAPTPYKEYTKIHKIGRVMDQGDSPMCVAYSWKMFMESVPNPVKENEIDVKELYERALVLDVFEGDDPDFGTTVRAGAKALKKMGYVNSSYNWGNSAKEAWDFISQRGPVVCECYWHESMMKPDKKNFVEVEGKKLNGHSFVIYGVIRDENSFLCVNSWGTGWGDDGRFKIKKDELEKLLKEGGRVCSISK